MRKKQSVGGTGGDGMKPRKRPWPPGDSPRRPMKKHCGSLSRSCDYDRGKLKRKKAEKSGRNGGDDLRPHGKKKLLEPCLQPPQKRPLRKPPESVSEHYGSICNKRTLRRRTGQQWPTL